MTYPYDQVATPNNNTRFTNPHLSLNIISACRWSTDRSPAADRQTQLDSFLSAFVCATRLQQPINELAEFVNTGVWTD